MKVRVYFRGGPLDGAWREVEVAGYYGVEIYAPIDGFDGDPSTLDELPRRGRYRNREPVAGRTVIDVYWEPPR